MTRLSIAGVLVCCTTLLARNAIAFTPIQHRTTFTTFTTTTTTVTAAAADDATSSTDIMDWFLNEPASPIFLSMVQKLPSDTWDPIKYQLDSVPVFYCGVEDVRPEKLPFECHLDVDEAEGELRSLRGGKGFGGGGDAAGRDGDRPKPGLLPMTLGDAFENAAAGYSTVRASRRDTRLAGLDDRSAADEDERSFVPVFGIKMSVREEEEGGGVVTGLTDRLYFDGGRAREVLEKIIEEQQQEREEKGGEGEGEEVTYELFVVSLVKAIEYMILDKESEFRFEFVPPESSLEYIHSNYDV